MTQRAVITTYSSIRGVATVLLGAKEYELHVAAIYGGSARKFPESGDELDVIVKDDHIVAGRYI